MRKSWVCAAALTCVTPGARADAPVPAAARTSAAITARPTDAAHSHATQTDLDAFMHEVLVKRDDNWKKLQQYVLDERETIDLKGPGQTPVWGERREYTWFIRDGFFVRSPLEVNGVAVGESDRRRYEADFLARERRRERRRAGSQAEAAPTGDVEGLLRQTRQPEFISSAYFLRFRFDEGRYALVGRETLADREVLKIEYYPTNLFRGTDRRRSGRETSPPDKAYDAEFRRLMNKTALVTLWIEPNAHQIVKYTFDNIALDFLPAQWLLHVDDLHASMSMGQPFPDVWLPNALEFKAALTVAVGQFDVNYAIQYHDYRRADVTTKVTIPKDR
jgi:hypothetical protein